MSTKTIQMTLFDYFKDDESFTLADVETAVAQSVEVKRPSIRARIYEGIDKGMFTRLAKGVYSCITKGGATCVLINGDGRDLSFLDAGSIDAIITDHPYELIKSHKGGNRDLAAYDVFRYKQKDFIEKARVLKPGGFLVEFLPEETAENFKYLNDIKTMAENAGFNYYSKVPWEKTGFVANTGRKSKNTEDVLIFALGKARALRQDVKKNLASNTKDNFMSGTAKMLPTSFTVAPVNRKERQHQAEKPVELLKQIIEYVSVAGETILDQFAGSCATGVSALLTGRNSILVEKDCETFENGFARLQNI